MNMGTLIFRGLLLFLCSALLLRYNPASARGNTFYIATKGSDAAGDGSFKHPWKSFAKGISVLGPGDTLRVFGGVYNEQVSVDPEKRGTPGNEITIESAPNVLATIKFSTNIDHVVKISGSYITFRNFEIDGSDNTYTDDNQCVLVRPSASATGSQVNIILDQLIVHGCSGHGIDVGGTFNGSILEVKNTSITNNKVYDSSLINIGGKKGNSGWGSGIKISKGADGMSLGGNIVHDNWGEGIAVTRGKNVDVYNNVVSNNYAVNIYIDNSRDIHVRNNFSYCVDGSNAILHSQNKAAGIAAAEEKQRNDIPAWGNQLANVKIVNNIIYNCHQGFAFFGTDFGTGGMRDSIIANNTFYMTDSKSSVFYIYKESETSIDVYNNIFRANPSSNVFVYYDGVDWGRHSFHHNYWVYEAGIPDSIESGPGDIHSKLELLGFTTSPGFSADTFSIGPHSLAIDSGSIEPQAIPIDFYYNPRTGKPDMGALEFIK